MLWWIPLALQLMFGNLCCRTSTENSRGLNEQIRQMTQQEEQLDFHINDISKPFVHYWPLNDISMPFVHSCHCSFWCAAFLPSDLKIFVHVQVASWRRILRAAGAMPMWTTVMCGSCTRGAPCSWSALLLGLRWEWAPMPRLRYAKIACCVVLLSVHWTSYDGHKLNLSFNCTCLCELFQHRNFLKILGRNWIASVMPNVIKCVFCWECVSTFCRECVS